MASHYIPWMTQAVGQFQRAACGELVLRTAHSAEPTCQECAAFLVQDSADFEALQNEPIDRSLLVKHVDFNPTAGYTPKGGRR